jgi:glycine/D-amino acid oxidase-like deaminating enzyme
MALLRRADVAIVGGGFAGAATAYFLARAGIHDVVVLEREATCGAHASGRNAALGRQLPSQDGFADLTVPGAQFLREPPAGFAVEPLLGPHGSLLLCGRPETLRRTLARAGVRGLPHEALGPDAIVERWPRLHGAPVCGGVLFPTDGVIDVHALLQGFLTGARRAGAHVVTGCTVTGFRPDATFVTVETSAGPLVARCVVVAAGAWAESVGRTAGATSLMFDPVRRHLFLTAPVADLDPTAPFAWHLDDEFYVRPESGAYLLSGCDAVSMPACDPAPAASAVPDLAHKLQRVAPPLAELGIARVWACLRTFTADATRLPTLRWDADIPWLYWVAGLGGHGATASPTIGQRAAADIAARLSS